MGQTIRDSIPFYIAFVPDLRSTNPQVRLITGDFAPGVKRPGYEAVHSRLCSAEVKNEWRYTSTRPLCLHGVNRDSFSSTSSQFILV
jgi:hypothetical protein